MSRRDDPRARDLDTLLLRQIQAVWRDENWRRFGSRLRPPGFALHDGEGDLGRWDPRTRTLSLSRRLVREAPWGEVVAVLLHEMAHQYVTEVVRCTDEPPHGPTFRAACRRFGVDPSATGRPAAGGAPAPKVVRRVRALLALSSSPNEHEASAALAAAHRLLLRHNLSEAEVTDAEGARPRYGWRHVGPIRQRIPIHEKGLAALLREHFFVETLWVDVYDRGSLRWGKQLELTGTPGNLEVAGWVHGTVLETAERLWLRARRERGLSGRERRAFLLGLVRGFGERLREESRTCREEEGLVWLGDPALRAWFARRHPRTTKMGRAAPVWGRDGYRAGHEAGRKLELHRPLRGGSGGGTGGRIEG